MATAFDTLKYAKQLKQAGVPEEQAEIHAEALRWNSKFQPVLIGLISISVRLIKKWVMLKRICVC